MYKAADFLDLSLSQWVSHAPPELIAQHLGISQQTLRRFPSRSR
jgi:oxalate decarboxylase